MPVQSGFDDGGGCGVYGVCGVGGMISRGDALMDSKTDR